MKIILDEFSNLTKDQIGSLSRLEEIYNYWNDKINIISRKDIKNINIRHILHSLSIAKFIQFKDHTTILDLGTGGGFPGIPLSIIFPNCNFILVDSTKKKIKVVNEVINELGIENVKTEWSRIEDLNCRFDFIVTRAVAKMPQIIQWSKHNFNQDSINKIRNGIIALKGGDLNNELSGIEIKKVLFLKDIFKNKYFDDKKLIYVPIANGLLI